MKSMKIYSDSYFSSHKPLVLNTQELENDIYFYADYTALDFNILLLKCEPSHYLHPKSWENRRND